MQDLARGLAFMTFVTYTAFVFNLFVFVLYCTVRSVSTCFDRYPTKEAAAPLYKGWLVFWFNAVFAMYAVCVMCLDILGCIYLFWVYLNTR